MKLITEHLSVPESLWHAPAAFYNPRTRILLLDGPRGPLLARYLFPDPPDPERYIFQTTYADNYQVFEGDQVPNIAPADATSVALPVPRSADYRGSVYSGATTTGAGNTLDGVADVQLRPSPKPGTTSTMLNQSGIRLGGEGMEAHFAGTGLSMDASGVRFEGDNFSLRTTVDKGMTRESPLFGILPKTAVTFWAADYLPDVEKMDKWAKRIATIITLTNVAVALFETFENLQRRLAQRR